MESVEGTIRDIVFERTELCKVCSGAGGATDHCSVCHGNGYITVRRGTARYNITCEHCSGLGVSINEHCKYHHAETLNLGVDSAGVAA